MAKKKKELVDRLKERFLKESLNLVNYNIPTTNNQPLKPLNEIFINDYEVIKPHILKDRTHIKNIYTGKYTGSFKIKKSLCDCGSNQHLVISIEELNIVTECIDCYKKQIFLKVKENDEESEVDSLV